MRTWKYRCKASKHVVYYGTAFIFDNCVKCKSFKSWWMNNKVQGHWIWICSLANIFSPAYRNLTAAELWQWQRTFCASLYAETSFNVNYRNIQHRNSLLSKQQWNWSVIFVYLPLSCMKYMLEDWAVRNIYMANIFGILGTWCQWSWSLLDC